MCLKIRDPSQFCSQSQNEDGSVSGRRVEKIKEYFTRAGVGKEPSGDGKMVTEAEAKWLSSNHKAPGYQDSPREVGQDVRGGGSWVRPVHPSAKRVEGEGEEVGEGAEEEHLAPD